VVFEVFKMKRVEQYGIMQLRGFKVSRHNVEVRLFVGQCWGFEYRWMCGGSKT
jgi:hypothetical protein